MKKNRYSDEQIVRILREADKDPVPEVAKTFTRTNNQKAKDNWKAIL